MTFLLLSTILKMTAQDYLISFAASGDATTISSVIAENLVSGKTVVLNAGEALHLKSVLGAETRDIVTPGIHIYPNPASDFSILTIVTSSGGIANISMVDISGKTVRHTSPLLPPGTHRFKVSGMRSGIYFVRVSGTDFEYSTKLVSQNNLSGRTGIEYISYTGNTIVPVLKSNAATVEMQYTEGDLLLLKGISGSYSTLITDIPVSSKTMTFNFSLCNDYDGNYYSTLTIGDQVWMAQNLATTHFCDGADIPLVESKEDWDALSYTDKAYCFYDNSLSNSDPFGALYTWAAAMNGAESTELNPSYITGACPCGWHLPSDEEWVELEMYLGMSYEEAYGLAWRGTTEGGKLKTTFGWYEDGNGTNSSGFSALPGGSRINSMFSGMGKTTIFWSTTEYFNNHTLAFNRSLSYQYSQIGWFSASHYYGYPKKYGLSVRCVKN